MRSCHETVLVTEVLVIFNSLTKESNTCQRLNLLQVELGTTETTLVCPLDRTSFTPEFVWEHGRV